MKLLNMFRVQGLAEVEERARKGLCNGMICVRVVNRWKEDESSRTLSLWGRITGPEHVLQGHFTGVLSQSGNHFHC